MSRTNCYAEGDVLLHRFLEISTRYKMPTNLPGHSHSPLETDNLNQIVHVNRITKNMTRNAMATTRRLAKVKQVVPRLLPR